MTDRGGARRWRLVRARRDAIPASVRRFTARARRRRLRAAGPWLIGTAVLALAAGLGAVVCLTPLLGVAEIRVAGTQLVTVDEVRTAAAVRRGTPLARVDLERVTRRVGVLPPVQRATAARDWPDTLVIRVVERTGVATVRQPTGFGTLDASGMMFSTTPTRPPDLPLVTMPDPGPGDPSTRAALAVVVSLTEELRSRLVELVAEAPARIRLKLTGGREVVWGDAADSETKARVATSLLPRPGKVIDVSAPNLVTVR